MLVTKTLASIKHYAGMGVFIIINSNSVSISTNISSTIASIIRSRSASGNTKMAKSGRRAEILHKEL